MLNHWNYSGLLISTCAKLLHYREYENHYKDPFLTDDGTNEDVKIKLFLGKYQLEVV